MDGFSRWILSAIPAVPDRVPYVRRQAVAVLELWVCATCSGSSS